MTKKITYNNVKVEYDDSALNRWSVMRRLFDSQTQFDAMDEILLGKADEVAEKLGDSIEEMMGLLNRIASVEGNTAKN